MKARGKAAKVRLAQDVIDSLEDAFGHYDAWWVGYDRLEGKRIEISGKTWADIKAHPLTP